MIQKLVLFVLVFGLSNEATFAFQLSCEVKYNPNLKVRVSKNINSNSQIMQINNGAKILDLKHIEKVERYQNKTGIYSIEFVNKSPAPSKYVLGIDGDLSSGATQFHGEFYEISYLPAMINGPVTCVLIK